MSAKLTQKNFRLSDADLKAIQEIAEYLAAERPGDTIREVDAVRDALHHRRKALARRQSSRA